MTDPIASPSEASPSSKRPASFYWLIVVVVGSLIGIAVFVFNSNFREIVLSWLPGDRQPSIEERVSRARTWPEELRDYFLVEQDHKSIVGWLLRCNNVQSIDTLPPYISSQLILPSANSLGIYSYASYSKSDTKSSDVQFGLRQHALLQLSVEISEQRLTLLSKSRSSYQFWEITALIAIFIGMVTTILVSISSTEFGRGDGTLARFIRVLAIIFPAVGTAAAAITSFYSPQAEWGQATRTLASDTQLHDQIAYNIWSIDCPKNGEDGPKFAGSLDEWSKRFTDIQAVSTSGSPSSGPQGSGNGPNPSPSATPLSTP